MLGTRNVEIFGRITSTIGGLTARRPANVSLRLLVCINLRPVTITPFTQYIFDQCPRIATTEMTASSSCSKCGLIKKSGRISCCGHGGSWFGNCGGADDFNIDHTWLEGLQACKARSHLKTVMDQQRNGDQQEMNLYSSGTDNASSQEVITAAKPLAFASAPTSNAPSIIWPVNAENNDPAMYASPKINLKPTTAVVETSAQIPVSHNFVNVLVTALVHTAIDGTSGGFHQFMEIKICIILCLTVTVL